MKKRIYSSGCHQCKCVGLRKQFNKGEKKMNNVRLLKENLKFRF